MVVNEAAMRRTVDMCVGSMLPWCITRPCCSAGAGVDPVHVVENAFVGSVPELVIVALREESWPVQAAGGRMAMVEAALCDAYLWLVDRLGSNTECWRWGDVHRMVQKHPFGAGSALMGEAFDVSLTVRLAKESSVALF
jgi:penicillin amidase